MYEVLTKKLVPMVYVVTSTYYDNFGVLSSRTERQFETQSEALKYMDTLTKSWDITLEKREILIIRNRKNRSPDVVSPKVEAKKTWRNPVTSDGSPPHNYAKPFAYDPD